jgi:hypothetical protein
MIALLGTLWPFLVGGAGIVWGLFMHWRTTAKVNAAVEQTKVDTTAQVQQDVANASAVAATQAQVAAVQVRTDAQQDAHETATQGTAALDAALADKGALRD